MQIETVAEGIEATEQAETLRSLGCEFGQGFLFARPLEPAAWEAVMRTGSMAGATSAASDGAVVSATSSAQAAGAAAPSAPGAGGRDPGHEPSISAVARHRNRRAAA
jgi:hypothetical protein